MIDGINDDNIIYPIKGESCSGSIFIFMPLLLPRLDEEILCC